ncbi:rod shape-determining protein MreD [Dysgonomonas sp. 511]|uniref:rod shape-determining protein MreD n=1 Tax=Dysgonomonas sp. 511 TaxID=2302930 RepID=UPI0013D66CD2|nr:rod shape-determining protein MreD [Dysgonomonas sp. 511]NDV78262.1 rod shape-determining protein MreD [Dysgonomonas sp. 511]
MLKSNAVRYTFMFVLLVLLQVLVFNRITFLYYAVPFAYIYFIIKLPIGTNRNITTLLGFLLGFTIDIFTNTPGINAATTTLIGFLCIPIQKLIFATDDYNGQAPAMSIHVGAFVKYTIFLTLVHHIVLMSLESFSCFNIELLLIRIFASFLITTALILAFEGLFRKKKQKSSWQKTA